MEQLKQSIKRNMPNFVKQHLIHRDELMRENISKEHIGLEIGPSHHPITAKKEGYHVDIVDWLDREGLKEQYKDHAVNLEAIEEVDYVWKGGSYYQLINKSKYYDYIIASHVIEHTTDFLGFLQDCAKMLKPMGILRLAVPDKRYCFDHFRDVTGIAEVLNNFYYPNGLQSVGKVAEYFANVVTYKEKISWKKRFGLLDICECNKKKYTFLYAPESVKENMRRVREDKEYIDIHHYVFTPTSFELLIADLRNLELLDLEIVHKYPTYGNEFLVTLQKTQRKSIVDFELRKKILKKRNRENRI